MPTNDAFQGVSNCYVFKSRLQEYAQKVGVPTPVYDTIKEGPSHEPYFKSSVIVNDVRYDSLPGFSNRKAAEQSAAEVALRELAKSGDVNQCISQPVHETGLCKNLLQEYAQKMNYAIPLYQCEKEEGRITLFQCTIEIGGIRYIGAAAKTKKEAEIKAARTALLAIQSSASESANKQIEDAHLTVLPCKKRAAEPTIVQDAPAPPKAKKGRFKKKASVKRLPETAWAGKAKTENLAKLVREWDMKREMAAIQCTVTNSQDGANQSGRERAAVESYSTPGVAEPTVLAPPNQSTDNETAWAGKAKTENLVKLVREWDKKREMAAIQCTVTNSQDGANQSGRERAVVESSSMPRVGEPTVLAPPNQSTNNETQSKDVNEICGVGDMVVQKPINGSSFTLGETSEVESGSSHVATIFNHQLE